MRVSDLTERFGVSDMTIRRDLDTLARRGLVEKVHGGATAMSETRAEEPGFEVKSSLEQAAKEQIALTAASLVRPATAIAVSAGTTTWAFARHIGQIPDLTVVTNSIRVAEMLERVGGPHQTVILTGGVRTPSDALVGPVAVQSVRSLHVDQLFMGVHGLDLEGGFTTPNLLEAETNRALMAAARRVVVLADHTKFGVIALCSIGRLDDADVVVSDPDLADADREMLMEHVGEVVLAPADGSARQIGT